MKMPFGKHRGRRIEDVPEDYLCWVLDNCENISATLREAIVDVLDLGSRSAGSAELSVDVANVWYRRLALEFHPDHGGNHEGMKAVNRGRELLVELIG